MKRIHPLQVQEVGVGAWAWGEEKDWEQLLGEYAGGQQGMKNWVMQQPQGACPGAEAHSSTASGSRLHGGEGRREARCCLLQCWSRNGKMPGGPGIWSCM